MILKKSKTVNETRRTFIKSTGVAASGLIMAPSTISIARPRWTFFWAYFISTLLI